MAGVEPQVLDGLPGIALDIDTGEDLAKLLIGKWGPSKAVEWALKQPFTGAITD